jgi:hypothetical protein
MTGISFVMTAIPYVLPESYSTPVYGIQPSASMLCIRELTNPDRQVTYYATKKVIDCFDPKTGLRLNNSYIFINPENQKIE